MQNPNDRSLDGKEREQERIVVKRIENSIKKIEFEIQINSNEVEKLGIDNEEKRMQIINLAERRDDGKKLIGGAKISDVFPPKSEPGKDKPTKIDTEEAKKHLEKVKKEQKPKREKHAEQLGETESGVPTGASHVPEKKPEGSK